MTLSHFSLWSCLQLPLSSAYSSMADANNAHDAKLAKQKQRLDPKVRISA